jgi:hypothetical protein
MTDKKKAHCPAPGAVVEACRSYYSATHAQTPAKAYTALITRGLALVAEARPDKPHLAEMCRRKVPRFDGWIATHIPSSAREQARHMKRDRAFVSLQELYLEAVLAALTERGFISPELEPTSVRP